MKVSAHKIKKLCFAAVQIFHQALRNRLSWEFHISELGMSVIITAEFEFFWLK